MATFNIYKEVQLPQILSPNSIYLIAPSNDNRYVEIYVTGKTTNVVRRIINESDIKSITDGIDESFHQVNLDITNLSNNKADKSTFATLNDTVIGLESELDNLTSLSNTLSQNLSTAQNDIIELSVDKADKSEVTLLADNLLNAKNDINRLADTKADKTYVDQRDQEISASIFVKANKIYVDQQDTLLRDDINLKADAQAVNQALTTKADLVNGVIPANQLPSFVDDVLEYADLTSFPLQGEASKIYIALDVNKTYRWGGSSYVEIGGGGVALGETSNTAYRGDRGKTAYDHSQSQGNPHNTTTSEIPEGTNFYFTEPRVRSTPLTGFSPIQASTISNTDTILSAFGKTQYQINNINQFSEQKVRDSSLTGLTIPGSSSSISTSDTVISSLGKLQSGLNNINQFTEDKVRSSLLTGLSIPASTSTLTASDNILTAIGKVQGNINNVNQYSDSKVRSSTLTGLIIPGTTSSISDTDNLLDSLGKLQGSLNNINQFSETKVRNSLLTGLTIPTTSGAIVATDNLITALGKLQKSINDASSAGGITWVHHSQVGTFITPANWNMTYTYLYFARYGGLLWIKGKLLPINSAPSAGTTFFTITDNNYKVKTLGINQANNKIFISQQEQTAILVGSIISNPIISDATSAASATVSIKVIQGLVTSNLYTIHPMAIEDLAIP